MSVHSHHASTEVEPDYAFALRNLDANISLNDPSPKSTQEGHDQPSLRRSSSTSTEGRTQPSPLESLGDHERTHSANESRILESNEHRLVEEEAIAQREDHSVKATRIQRFKDVWVWEILGLLLSLISVIAIATVLAIMNNKALSSWRMPIRPNALVSIFAAMSKSALILPITECISQFKWLYYSQNGRRSQDLQFFDDASRGPLGSLLFLWQFKARPAVMVTCCACVIMIAALAVDPFTQQIIDYPLRSVPFGDDNNATSSASRVYDTGLDNFSRSTLARFTDIGMQSAIFNGLYGLSLNPSFSCSTGNCTWPEITTLGICGSCVNVTAQTKQTGCGEVTMRGSRTCNYTTPGNFNISALSGTGANNAWWTTLNSSALDNDAMDTEMVSLTRFGLLRATGTVEKTFDMPPVEFSECQIYFCARRYSGFRISDGNVEAGTSTSAPVRWAPGSIGNPPWFVGVSPMKALEAPDTWSGNKSFIINVSDLSSTSDLLTNLFTTELGTENAYNSRTMNVDISSTLYKAGNLSQTIDNMATSMTNRIRQSRNSTQVIGQAFQDETFIRVRWPWFILPAALVFLTGIILQAAIMINHRRKALLWKSSMLPLLFHGFDTPVDAPAERLSQVEARAAAATAQLRATDKNDFRFVMSWAEAGTKTSR